MVISVEGKNGIKATIIADSVSAYTGKRMTTFEIEFHRYILAENNTHRSLSKNLQSSRAVPLLSSVEMVENNSAAPVHWGMNQPGMQSKEELVGDQLLLAQFSWYTCRDFALEVCKKLAKIGAHKQWAARLLEPFVMTKAVMSGTDWDNMLWLRNDEDAQPEFKVLAKCIQDCFDASEPVVLKTDEWHLPYVQTNRTIYGIEYLDSDGNFLSLDEAKKISASCCAQISYRRMNDTKEKAIEIFGKLFAGRKPHMSPTEHQATPIVSRTNSYDEEINESFNPDTWEDGVTHVRKDGTLCSGNLAGWIQLRQTLPNNVFVK